MISKGKTGSHHTEPVPLSVLPRKYKFATELAEVVIVGPSEGPVPMPESASITASATPCPSN